MTVTGDGRSARRLRPETIVLHEGWSGDPANGALAVPIFQTAAYRFPGAEQAADIFALAEKGFAYGRISNPTCAVLERRMAALEDGVDALAVSTGLAAITVAILNLAQAGDNIVTSTQLFGGTRSLFFNSISRLGIEPRFVDPADPEAFRRATDERTRCYFGETLANPRLLAFPIREVADIGDELGIPLVMDNTAAPLLCRPFDHGATVSVYSGTKWLGGHGTSLGGVLVDSGRFDWAAHADRFPTLNTPDRAFHDVAWVDRQSELWPSPYLLRARQVCVRDLGTTLSPFNAFLLMQGLETLPLRIRAHCANAEAVAALLATHEKVERVVYPGLFDEGEPLRRAKTYLTGGFGSLLQFELYEGHDAARRFIDALRIVKHVANVGDARTLAIHPASTTHSQLSPAEQLEAGVGPGTVRLSVGIEHPDDILDDVAQALAVA